MFWMRNKENNFQICILIWRPDVHVYLLAPEIFGNLTFKTLKNLPLTTQKGCFSRSVDTDKKLQGAPSRTLVKSVYQKIKFLISQPKHMLWVLKEPSQ